MLITGKKPEGKKGPAEMPAPVPPKAEEGDVKVKYVLPAIKDVQGESSCAIRLDDGRIFQFTATNGTVEVSRERDEEFCRVLEGKGWKVLELVDEPDDQAPAVAEKAPPRKYGRSIELEHPDLTEDNRPTALMTFDVGDGRLVNADMKEGLVETDDPALVRVLMEKGFRVMNPHTLEVEEEAQAAQDASPDPAAEEKPRKRGSK